MNPRNVVAGNRYAVYTTNFGGPEMVTVLARHETGFVGVSENESGSKFTHAFQYADILKVAALA